MSRTASIALTTLTCLLASAGLVACGGGGSSSTATPAANSPDIGQIPAGAKLLQQLRARALAGGVSPTVADCVIKSLRGSMTPQDLADLLKTRHADASLRSKLAAVGHACAAK